MKNGLSKKTYIHVLIIAVLAYLIYSNTFHADFVFDDEIYIVQNPAIKDFSYFQKPFKVLQLPNFTSDFTYAFLTRIAGYFTFALNYHLHGLEVTGYHFVNLLIHMTNALLVYFLARTVFQTPFFSDLSQEQTSSSYITGDIFALCSALIFLTHPVQTQAVTYVVQRWTSLATLFFLLSVFAYVKSRLSGSAPLRYGLYALSFMSAVTAMLVKEISFTLPVVITLFEVFFFREKYGKRALLLFPLALTMLVIPAVLLAAQGAVSIENIGQSMNTLASYPDISRTDYLFTQFRVIVTYIRLLLLPVNQNLDYDYPVYHSFLVPPVFFSFLFLLLLFCLGVYFFVRSRKREAEGGRHLRLISLGILWFFITISVESSIIPIKDIIFEHRIYLPSVGFILALMGAVTLGARKVRSGTASRALAAVMLCAVFILGGASYARNSVWKTNVSLWEDVVRKSPSKARPHNNLGVAYDKQGRTGDAVREYLLAIAIDPDYKEVHYNLGVAYDKQGRTDDAVKELLTAIRINPSHGQAHNSLGIIYGRMGRHEDAMREFLSAVQINPAHSQAHNNLGIIYGRVGRYEDAVNEFLTAIRLSPDYVEAHYNLGITYKTLGRLDGAVAEFRTALGLKPDHAGARKNLEDTVRMK